jgi:POT family proton-dependent oligopeptide transporter
LPIGLALSTRLSPSSLQGVAASLFFFAHFFGNLLVGWLGSYVNVLTSVVFWLLHAGIVFLSGLILMILSLVSRARTATLYTK